VICLYSARVTKGEVQEGQELVAPRYRKQLQAKSQQAPPFETWSRPPFSGFSDGPCFLEASQQLCLWLAAQELSDHDRGVAPELRPHLRVEGPRQPWSRRGSGRSTAALAVALGLWRHLLQAAGGSASGFQ